jgi:ATP-dependent helicase HrpA
VTVHVPLTVLNQVSGDEFEWQIPGFRQHLVTALIRSLPKAVRRNFVPAPDHAKAALERVTPRAEPMFDALERELQRMTGVSVPRDAWDIDGVPRHLRVTFRVVDEKGRSLGEDKHLETLKRRLKDNVQAQLSKAASDIEQSGLGTWSLGALPRTFVLQRGKHAVQGYPSLVDEGDSVAVRVLGTEAEQLHAMWQGTRRLLLLNLPPPVKAIHGRLTNQVKLALNHKPHPTLAALFDDCVACAADKLIAEFGGPAWDEEGFARLHAHVRGELNDTVFDVVAAVALILTTAHEIEKRVQGATSLALLPALTDIKAQLAGLVHPGFVTATGWRRLPDVLRYLRGIERRLERLPGNPHRDRELVRSVERVQQAYRQLIDGLPPGGPVPAAVREIGWMIQELRISYFAQTLGTAAPVSEKRIFKAMDEIG